MKSKFNQIMAEVDRKYDHLRESLSFTWNTVPKKYEHGAGVYLFSENDKPLVSGRICTHLGTHNLIQIGLVSST